MLRRFAFHLIPLLIAVNTSSSWSQESPDDPQWQRLRGPYTGVIESFFVDPENGLMLAGTNRSGLFRSTDNGHSWENVSSDIINVQFFAGERGHYLAGNGNVYLSTDDGQTWTEIPGLTGLNSIAVHDSLMFFTSPSGSNRAKYSTNRGKSWNFHSFPTNNGAEFCFTFGSQIGMIGDSTLYLLSGVDPRLQASWKTFPLEVTITNDRFKSSDFTFIGTIDNYLFVKSRYDTLYRSGDTGKSWERIWVSGTEPTTRVKTWITGETLYVSTPDAIYISTDQGATLQNIFQHSIHPRLPWQVPTVANLFFVHKGTWISDKPVRREGVPLSRNQGGIYRSLNSGMDWLQVGGRQAFVSDIKFRDGRVFVSSHDFLVSHNRDSHWEPVIGGDGDARIQAFQHDVSLVAFNNLTYRSTDRGQTWDTLQWWSSPAAPDSVMQKSGPIFMSRGYHLFRLDDQVLDWDTVHTINSAGGRMSVSSNVATIDGTLFITTNDQDTYRHCLYRSTDLGKNWQQLECDISGKNPILTTGERQVLIERFLRTFLAFDASGNVDRITYKDFSQTLLAYMYGDSLYFAAVSKGVFQTSDKGRTWQDISEGLPSTLSRTLRLFWNNSTLFLVFNEGKQHYADSIFFYDLPVSLKKFQLTVQNGYGSGYYSPGDTVHIWSRELASDEVFTEWASPISDHDRSLLRVPDEWHTTVVMPKRDVTLQAQIEEITIPPYTIDTIKTELDVVITRTLTPERPVGTIALFHDEHGMADDWLTDVEKYQFVKDALKSQFTIALFESIESTLGDQNSDGKLQWLLTPLSTENQDLNEVTTGIDELTSTTSSLFTLGVGNGGDFASGVSAVLKHKGSGLFCAGGLEDAYMQFNVPTIFCLATNDSNNITLNSVALDHYQQLQSNGVKTEYIAHSPSPLYPQRFARIEGIDTNLSRQMFNEIKGVGFIGERGYLQTQPSIILATIRSNSASYPVIGSLSATLLEQVEEQLNATYSEHEFYSDINKTVLRFFKQLTNNSGIADETQTNSSLMIYPQPSDGNITISFELDEPAQVSIQLIDLQGKEVSSLLEERKATGHHRLEWEVTNLHGIYIVQLRIDDHSQSRLVQFIQ